MQCFSIWDEQRQIYEQRLQSMQAQLDEAFTTVRNQALKINSLYAENDNLTETVTSLVSTRPCFIRTMPITRKLFFCTHFQVRLMERKQLEAPELRAQHILDLQRSLSDSQAMVKHLQAQLGERTEDTSMHAYHTLRNEAYEAQTTQAQRVENLLVAAIMSIPKR